MVVNRDQENAHRVRIAFRGASDEKPDSAVSFAGPVEIATFGSSSTNGTRRRLTFMAHAETPGAPSVAMYTNGKADPDGPIAHAKQNASK